MSIPHFFQTFTVRMGELNREGVVAVPTLCGYLQDIATDHAASLGFGLQDLIAMNRTWMLSRLTLETTARLQRGDTLTLETWPQGVRRNLIAVRDFIGRDKDGNVILMATSEWLFVDTQTKRIVRVPDYFVTMTNNFQRGASLLTCDAPEHLLRKSGDLRHVDSEAWQAATTETITIRHSDIDVNRHVNNTRYADWLLEPLIDTKGCMQPARLDILYKAAATDADTIRSSVSAEENGIIRHRLTRVGDNATLVVATTHWQ